MSGFCITVARGLPPAPALLSAHGLPPVPAAEALGEPAVALAGTPALLDGGRLAAGAAGPIAVLLAAALARPAVGAATLVVRLPPAPPLLAGVDAGVPAVVVGVVVVDPVELPAASVVLEHATSAVIAQP
jgi:hypothetical protein